MRKDLFAAGVAAMIVGVVFIVLAATTFSETVTLYGMPLRTANQNLLYSGIGLVLAGILLVILSPAKLKKSPSEARHETARARAEEEIDVIKILKRSFKSLIDEPGFLLLYLISFVVMLIAFAHVCLTFGTLTPWTTIGTYSALTNFVSSWILWIIVYAIAFIITMLTSQSAIILKAAAMKRGRSMSLTDALTEGIRRVPSLFVVVILVGVIVAGPLFLIIGALVFASLSLLMAVLALVLLVWFIPMIYIGIRLALYAPACVLENLGPVECMRECWRMTKGNFWLIFVTGFLLGIVSMVMGLIPIIGFLIAMILVGPVQIIAYTLIYLGLRKTRPSRK